MAQSSVEVIRRAVEFAEPDRLPRSCGEVLGLASDTYYLWWNQLEPWRKEIDFPVADHWGCLWVQSETVRNMGQIKGYPLQDWQALDSYRWPDPDEPRFYTGMQERFAGSEGKYVLVGYFMLIFERMWALRGFDNLLTDLLIRDERTEMLADRVVDFALGWIRNVSRRFPGRIHGVHFSDDWGTQQGLMVRPDIWRDFFKHRYKRLFDAMHAVGWHAWMHTDGKINDIVGDLIEVGVDALQLEQPALLGIAEIGEKYSGKVCFQSQCDIQTTLPLRSIAEIQQEARFLLEQWSTAKGGFVVMDYGSDDIGVSVEKREKMLEAFLAADPWKA
jgi:hypothetical protein